MSVPPTIPNAVRDVQIAAANPEISAFVSANAGSGKTYVLAQRAINLLLSGVDPAKILCITFTKTAAANMANEVFKRLAQWTTLDDATLDERIRLSTGKKPSAAGAGAGAPAVRLGAGNAGRLEGADHPRLLHAAAAPVSVRGQCGGALFRAGRGLDRAAARAVDAGRAARSLRRARQRARPSAGAGHRRRRRYHLQGGDRRRHQAARRDCRLDRARRRHRRGHRATVAGASASHPTTALEDVDAEILFGLAHSG